jgi:intracellular septation protein
MPELTRRTKSLVRLAVDYSGAATFVIAFFATWLSTHPHRGDIQSATWWLVAVSALALGADFVIERRVAPLPLIYGGAALVFGGLTLVFHDSRFVKMKTTFIDLALGAAMLIGLALGRSPIRLIMNDSIHLTEPAWRRLTLRFGIFFLCMALLNEIVWRTQPDAVWVLFRMPGLLIIAFLFSFTQVPMMMKDAQALEAATRLTETQQ